MHTNLEQLMREINSWSSREPEEGAAPFVTISRQAGAPSHRVAEEIVARLPEWRVYDWEICAKLLEDPSMTISLPVLLSERYHNQVEDLVWRMIAGTPPQYNVYVGIFRIVRELARAGKAVIIGHDGACCTRDYSGGVHVRLVASERTRVARLARRDGLSPADARERVQELEGSRAKAADTFFGRDLADPLLYDAVWNADRVSPEEIASSVVSLIGQRSDPQAHFVK